MVNRTFYGSPKWQAQKNKSINLALQLMTPEKC